MSDAHLLLDELAVAAEHLRLGVHLVVALAHAQPLAAGHRARRPRRPLVHAALGCTHQIRSMPCIAGLTKPFPPRTFLAVVHGLDVLEDRLFVQLLAAVVVVLAGLARHRLPRDV